MRLTRVRIAVAAGLLALSGTVTATALAVVPASAGSSPVVMVSCAGQGQVRPGGYDVGCTANELLRTLYWQTWRGTAYGNGVLKVDDCTPTCAQGKYIDYPVLIVLWRPTSWPGHAGHRYFSRMTWIFTGKRPGHAHAAQTLTLPAY
ncbi:MAG TPA: hypothetical protein VIF35_10120 [Streptosporangiaceae bacterium]|jgi:hypothetical protein